MTTRELGEVALEPAREVEYTRDERVLWRRTIGAVHFLSPLHPGVLTLHGPGAALWDLLREPCTLHRAAVLLATRYRVPIDTVRHDIEPILEELTSRQVLRRIEPV